MTAPLTLLDLRDMPWQAFVLAEVYRQQADGTRRWVRLTMGQICELTGRVQGEQQNMRATEILVLRCVEAGILVSDGKRVAPTYHLTQRGLDLSKLCDRAARMARSGIRSVA